MARIQIADLQTENVMELTAEEQVLVQGGFFFLPLGFKLLKLLISAGEIALMFQ